MKKDLATFLYQLRIPAEVNVIEMVSLTPSPISHRSLSPSPPLPLLQPDTDISAYTYERTLIMEQRNELLQKMRMSEKQKKGDVQHLLARSFSTRQVSIQQTNPLTPLSPPGEISIEVPQFPRIHMDPQPPTASSAALSLADVTVEPSSNHTNSIPMTTITEELGVEETCERLASSQRVKTVIYNFCFVQLQQGRYCHRRHDNVETAVAVKALRKRTQYENLCWTHRFPTVETH